MEVTLKFFCNGQGCETLMIKATDGHKFTGLNAVNKSGKWTLIHDTRLPLDTRFAHLVGRDVTHIKNTNDLNSLVA